MYQSVQFSCMYLVLSYLYAVSRTSYVHMYYVHVCTYACIFARTVCACVYVVRADVAHLDGPGWTWEWGNNHHDGNYYYSLTALLPAAGHPASIIPPPTYYVHSTLFFPMFMKFMIRLPIYIKCYESVGNTGVMIFPLW